jgi:hypothetical protein
VNDQEAPTTLEADKLDWVNWHCPRVSEFLKTFRWFSGVAIGLLAVHFAFPAVVAEQRRVTAIALGAAASSAVLQQLGAPAQ